MAAQQPGLALELGTFMGWAGWACKWAFCGHSFHGHLALPLASTCPCCLCRSPACAPHRRLVQTWACVLVHRHGDQDESPFSQHDVT